MGTLHRMMVWSQIRLLLLLALVSVPVFGQDPDLTLIKERELEAVRDKIRDLKTSMDRRAAERDRITGELQTAEVLIAERRNHLKDLERQRAFSEKKKAGIDQQLASRQSELAAESEQL